MDVHRPKPWHGAREFLKEIAIIVVGVLIAISAEQIVEALHWQQRVAAGRDSLKSDFREILWNAGEVEGEEACVRSRLATISDTLINNPKTTPGIGQIGNPPSRGWYPSSWDSLVASNVATHMSRQNLVRLADIAVRARYIEQTQDAALSDWAKIYAVLGPKRALEQGEFSQTLSAISDAQFRLNEISLIAPQLSQEVIATKLLSADDLKSLRGDIAHTLRGPNALRICGPTQRPRPGVVDAPNAQG